DACAGDVEIDCAWAEIVVGVEDRLPERPWTIVLVVEDGESAREGSILEACEPGDERAPAEARARPGFRMTRRRAQPHVNVSLAEMQGRSRAGCIEAVCDRMTKSHRPGRADRSPGRCRAGEGLAWW